MKPLYDLVQDIPEENLDLIGVPVGLDKVAVINRLWYRFFLQQQYRLLLSDGHPAYERTQSVMRVRRGTVRREEMSDHAERSGNFPPGRMKREPGCFNGIVGTEAEIRFLMSESSRTAPSVSTGPFRT